MHYRDFGKTGYKISQLGMGCMRLPFIDDNDLTKGVDRERAYELIRYAVDNGINFFDTAQGYHAQTSEEILGEALEEGGRRAKVKIATKHPFWQIPPKDEVRRNLERTLKKLRTDHIDFFLMHGIGPGNWEAIQKNEIFALFEQFKSEGLIKHISFSYHGNWENFKEVVETYPWEMCLVMQNMLDIDREVTEKGILHAHKHGVAVTIMEPLRGGGLCYAPRAVAAVYDGYSVKRTPTEWAFRHLVNYPEVGSIVSGMSSMEQLKENLEIFSKEDLKPNCLSAEEKAVIAKARQAYDSIVTIPCTQCGYCMPCPQNVDISRILGLYNDGHRFEFFDQPRRSYMFARRGGRGVDKCNGCGVCVPKCPQEIDIPKELQVAHAKLDGWNE